MPNIFESFFEAALAIKELCGREGYVAILQQELAREGVLARMAGERRASVAKAHPTDSATQRIVATLEFYADAANHEDRNEQPSAVSKDKGCLARRALGAMNDDEAESKGRD